MAISFDLFGTLVETATSGDPAAAVAAELRARDVAVPADFDGAYREIHVDAPRGAEVSLSTHVSAALSSRGVAAPDDAVQRAVLAAFEPDVTRRSGARAAIEAAAETGPIGLCSNCSVHGLVEETLARTDLCGAFDTVVTSVDCGWRKPDPRAFETVADGLGVGVESLVHVGDDPETDGGIERAGGEFIDVSETPLSRLGARLEAAP